MNHRISAGAIVIESRKVLLVRHMIKGKYDFRVPPGGGVIDEEGILAASVRGAREESGLETEAIRPIYLKEFYEPTTHHIKTWILCKLIGGAISVSAPEAARENIVEARFFSDSDISNEDRVIFPPLLRDCFWEDLSKGFTTMKYLGIHAMTHY